MPTGAQEPLRVHTPSPQVWDPGERGKGGEERGTEREGVGRACALAAEKCRGCDCVAETDRGVVIGRLGPNPSARHCWQ